jgi:SpoIID/LytB domain protein
VFRLVAVVVAALAATGVPATAQAADSWPVTPTATISISGDGYGHGKGLSQWGAQRAAKNWQLSYDQILGFYYPETALGEEGGRIKVRITADDGGTLVVDAQPGLTVRDLTTRQVWKTDQPDTKRWRIRAVAGGSEIAYRTDRWHFWRTVAGDAQFAAGSSPVALHTAGGVVDYRGALRSTMYDDGKTVRRVTVNVVPLDAYVRGVVPREVIASIWEPAAMQAQAVAARSYAAYERDHTSRTAYDLCDTAACQVYGGASAEYYRSDDAVAATARQVVTYGGAVAFTQFSASNGGWTVADAGFPYLTAQADQYDEWAHAYYDWTASLTDTAIEEQWPTIGNLTSISIDSRDGNGNRGGRVLTMTLTGDAGVVHPTGEQFRSRFGMKSTMFEITNVQ